MYLDRPDYPVDRELYGKSAWWILHSIAAQMPDKPTRQEQADMRTTFDTIRENIPCPACIVHSDEYVKGNPPDFSSRRKTVAFFCKFHNHIRESQGKATVDCRTLTRRESCSSSTCYRDMKETLLDYKKVSRRIIEEVAKREGIETPEILFEECPIDALRSCTKIFMDSGRIVVHINPHSFSLRTLLHEMAHVLGEKKHDEYLLTEAGAEEYAHRIIGSEFEKDVFKLDEGDRIYKDGGLILDSDRGILRNFDNFVAPVAKFIGLRPQDVSDYHVPIAAGSILATTADAFLSPLGSLIVYLTSATSITAATITQHANLAAGDRRLMTGLGAFALWRSVNLANPRVMPILLSEVRAAVGNILTGNWSGLMSILTENPYNQALAARQASVLEAEVTEPEAVNLSQAGHETLTDRGAEGDRASQAVPVTRSFRMNV